MRVSTLRVLYGAEAWTL